MAQDSDVARVAAAMNAPGFKYRSFGNEPVRNRPGNTGTLAQPLPEPPPPIEDILPEPLPPEPVLAMPEPMAEPFAPAPLDYQDLAYEPFPEVAEPEPPAPVMMAEPPPPPPPAPPAAPLFSWPETPVNPAPAPAMATAPSLLPEVAAAYAPPAPPPRAPVAPAPGGFRLLEAIGHRPGEGEPPRAQDVSGGTLGLLRRAAETEGAGDATMPGIGLSMGFGSTVPSPLPPLSPSGHPSGLLPAAAVTVPLSDVMRLIAVGATPPPSPFDAFRAALGAQPSR